MYAGSRWKKGCHPSELLKEDEYKTSSTKIQKILAQDKNAFTILRIDTFCDNLHPYEYESLFLESVDCKNSIDWLNKHNNDYCFPAFGSDEYNELILDKYNVTHINRLKFFIDKRKNTNLERYGSESYVNSEKAKETRLERYSPENGGYEDINKKRAKTKLEKYGDEFYFDIKKGEETRMEKYGVAYPLQSEEIKEKYKSTNLTKYGADNPAKNDLVKEKIKNTNLKNTGYSCALSNPEVREKSKRLCSHCKKKIDPGNFAQYHGDKCKMKNLG